MTVTNAGTSIVRVNVQDKYSGDRIDERLSAGESLARYYDLKPFHSWYDIVVTVEGDDFEYEFAGHVEDGRDSFSDPKMGRDVRHD